jgi:glutamate racemase
VAEPATIGVFDSGVGGLSVLRALRAELPANPVIYVADQAHVPYGLRSLEEVRGFSEGITRFLLGQGARLIVIACNTASAAALHSLRHTFPNIPFVGMEPAVKPAAERTQSGVVGVLATPATFQGALYASVVERFASGVALLQDTCPGLVAQVEAGDLDGERTRQILKKALRPMLAAGIDTVVLGCTHYPFVIPLIEEIAGPGVRVIDPAPAVARQARRLLQERGLLQDNPPGPTILPVQSGYAQGLVRFFTTGDPAAMRSLLPSLLGYDDHVFPLSWRGDTPVEK